MPDEIFDAIVQKTKLTRTARGCYFSKAVAILRGKR